MKPIIILLLLSLTLWGCGSGSQFADSNALTVKYDSAYVERSVSMQVRQDVPLDSTLGAFLPNEVPPIADNKSYGSYGPSFNCYYENVRTGAFRKDFCISAKEYLFREPPMSFKEPPQVKVFIYVHNNSESFKQGLKFSEFEDSEKAKKLPEYKGYKYSFTHDLSLTRGGSLLSILLPPFVTVNITAMVVDTIEVMDGYPNGYPRPGSAYLRNNWKKILDGMDLEKLNRTYNQNPIEYTREPK